MQQALLYLVVTAGSVWILRRVYVRLQLSRAKHPSLRGHARLSRRLSALLPYYAYQESEAFRCDGASPDLAGKRARAFAELAERLRHSAPLTQAATRELTPAVSDMQFTQANRVPFQFRELIGRHIAPAAFCDASDGVRLRDLDGNWSYDVGGSYGVNLLGYDYYKECIEEAAERMQALGPVLGPYHPVISDNVAMIREISGLDEVSFHMSGTEAVMQAVRLARFHTRRSQLVVFCGAYHGWWDGVQAGVGHNRQVDDIYMLSDMSEATLKVLRTRSDIACVLVNPLQALHPNSGASSDAMLLASDRSASFDREAYASWLGRLRQVCTEKGIVLIFDEVFVGFRLGLAGAQAYFGVQADMVTYGKTIGGGLPVGVVAGRSALMKRYRDDRPADVCFARGTFNSHPYVMASMNAFLRTVSAPEWSRAADAQNALWDERAIEMNLALSEAALPVQIANLSSIWTVLYTRPGRFNWLLQYYLRAEGLALSWVGTGRFIFSHNYTDHDFAEVKAHILRAAQKMNEAGWWTVPDAITNGAIRKNVVRELLAAKLSRRRRPATIASQAPDLPLPRHERESSDRSALL